VTPAETASRLVDAARNNADWCASVCRSHGISGVHGDTAWSSPRRSPPYYPDAVTLRRDAVAADILPMVDTVSPGCSVKDSFYALDLSAHGFVELFTAQWIYRPAELPSPSSPAVPVTTATELGRWQRAWSGPDAGLDVFRPSLLDDPSVLVLAVHNADRLCGGAVLNRSEHVVGLSNLFALDPSDSATVWSSAVAAAAQHFPGVPVVGYEHGDDLTAALAAGFSTLGPLRIWLHTA
jgi:hypothetical protein